jgi:phage gpG-like protein
VADPFEPFMEMLTSFADPAEAEKAVTSALGSESCRVAAVAGVRECFANSVSPDGEPWPPLKFARPGGSGSDVPLRDTDRLMAATTSEAEGTEISVMNNRRQAALQNFGGTIVPVNVNFLTIPNTLEAKRAGGARLFPEPLFPRINEARTGGALVDAEGIVQYWLTKKSVIPKREFIGFSEETVNIILEIVCDKVLKASMGKTP